MAVYIDTSKQLEAELKQRRLAMIAELIEAGTSRRQAKKLADQRIDLEERELKERQRRNLEDETLRRDYGDIQRSLLEDARKKAEEEQERRTAARERLERETGALGRAFYGGGQEFAGPIPEAQLNRVRSVVEAPPSQQRFGTYGMMARGVDPLDAMLAPGPEQADLATGREILRQSYEELARLEEARSSILIKDDKTAKAKIDARIRVIRENISKLAEKAGYPDLASLVGSQLEGGEISPPPPPPEGDGIFRGALDWLGGLFGGDGEAPPVQPSAPPPQPEQGAAQPFLSSMVDAAIKAGKYEPTRAATRLGSQAVGRAVGAFRGGEEGSATPMAAVERALADNPTLKLKTQEELDVALKAAEIDPREESIVQAVRKFRETGEVPQTRFEEFREPFSKAYSGTADTLSALIESVQTRSR